MSVTRSIERRVAKLERQAAARYSSLPTTYHNTLFRSRLEARWAVFFDTIGIRWVYEPECFLLKYGKKYLPDFWLPDQGHYLEIKPTANVLRGYDFQRYCELSVNEGFAILLGEPQLPVLGRPTSYAHLPNPISWYIPEGGRPRWCNVPDDLQGFRFVPVVSGAQAIMFYRGKADGFLVNDPRPWIWQERKDGSFLLWPSHSMEFAPDDDPLGIPVFLPEKGETPTCSVYFNPGMTKWHDSPALVAAYHTAAKFSF